MKTNFGFIWREWKSEVTDLFQICLNIKPDPVLSGSYKGCLQVSLYSKQIVYPSWSTI